MSAMFQCKSCNQPYLLEGTSGAVCNQCIYGTSKASAETVNIWDVLPTYKDYREKDDARIKSLEAACRDMKESLEFYASPWEHINHPDGTMVRKAESYDKFEDWHERAREVLNKHKDVL